MEKKAAPMRNITMLDPLTDLERNSLNGTSGVKATFSWISTKLTRSTAATAKIDKV
jgi:hypothetical protein